MYARQREVKKYIRFAKSNGKCVKFAPNFAGNYEVNFYYKECLTKIDYYV